MVPVPKPTKAELAILNVLWERGPNTVREVHESLSSAKEVRYITILKLLQIMTDKGLVTRDENTRSHIYAPRLPQETTQQQLLGDLTEHAFGGSASRLVLQALTTQRATHEELAEIRKLLDTLEAKDE